MSLTRSLGALFVLPVLLLASHVVRAEVGDRVVWTDARLHDGRLVKAAELTGRTVVVEYWATWCPFCMKQNPYVQRLHEQHGGKELVVLTISLDKTAEAVSEYKKKKGYSFPTVMENDQTKAWFPKRKGLPVVYVVDPAGRIVFHESGEMFEEDILGLVRYAKK
jgi:thiol-disulfide isomerase/thioredoxin